MTINLGYNMNIVCEYGNSDKKLIYDISRGIF